MSSKINSKESKSKKYPSNNHAKYSAKSNKSHKDKNIDFGFGKGFNTGFGGFNNGFGGFNNGFNNNGFNNLCNFDCNPCNQQIDPVVYYRYPKSNNANAWLPNRDCGCGH